MEIRLDHGFQSISDVDKLEALISVAFEMLPASASVVVCADWRRTPLMQDSASDRFGKMISAYNARIERSAALALAESPVNTLQFMRVIRESNHPNRRLFHTAPELLHYLDERLDWTERARLREFLGVR